MTDGYDGDSGQSDCTQFDILLAEYVDGSMEPEVREAFEEWMQVDPLVAERVEHLTRVRGELCRLGCQCAAPPGFEARLRRELSCEMMRDSMSGMRDVTPHLRLAAVMASLVLVMLAGGMAYNAALSVESASTAVAVREAMERLQVRSLEGEIGMTPQRADGRLMWSRMQRFDANWHAPGAGYPSLLQRAAYPSLSSQVLQDSLPAQAAPLTALP